MCGIAFALTRSLLPPEIFQAVCDACDSRGPDFQNTKSVQIGKYNLYFHAAVLHLRGDHVAEQPFARDGDVLIYLSSEENDGEGLFHLFRQDGPLSILPLIDGPYAFVFYESQSSTLYWSRDPLGRRSLLHTPLSDDAFLLSSVAPPDGNAWTEVDNAVVHTVRLDTETPVIHSHHRAYRSRATHPTSQIYPFDPLLCTIPNHSELLTKDQQGLPIPTQAFLATKQAFLDQLESSVRNRVSDIPRSKGPSHPKARVAVLFSGGLDCTVLALLADKFLPEGEAIDLLNVAFENPRSLANKAKSQQGIRLASDHNDAGEVDRPPQITSDDSTYSTPDRLTGLQSASELANLRPSRTWNFVQVNVPYAECTEARDHIVSMMKPNDTIMDLSIAQALYFAAKGTGLIGSRSTQKAHQSEARVLLSGLGADEQLGGYSRHKKAYASGSGNISACWSALIEELQMDLDRIGSRNLGRDDRVISSLGKEVRYPYLAGHVVAYLTGTPVHFKVDYSFGDGVGDKMLLRAIARDLGLQLSARYPKRAIQFGARSAKMEQASRSVKGNDRLI